jgi:hypothetical protein
MQAFGFRRTLPQGPLRKLTARSHLVPEPIVECGALAAVTDIRGMKESQDLRRSSSPIPARLTGDDLKDGPRSARFQTSDPRISLMRSADQLFSLRIGAALDPIPASQVDPKPRRSRSNIIVAHIPRRCRSRSLSGGAAAG